MVRVTIFYVPANEDFLGGIGSDAVRVPDSVFIAPVENVIQVIAVPTVTAAFADEPARSEKAGDGNPSVRFHSAAKLLHDVTR